MTLHLRYAVRSDLGLVRNNNEDSVYAGPRLLAIADGMGGHAAGEVASNIVISTLKYLDEDRRVDDLVAELRHSVLEANQRIADAVEDRGELEGMGTTLTALRFVGARVGLVHVGDSRAYLLRHGSLDQITHDDTYVQYLVDTGKLTPEEAKDHPRKSVILRALLGSEVEPDVAIRETYAGDRYLLCSDGLSDVVSAETIADTLALPDPQDAADRLVELALRGGGPDNVTVIVADVTESRAGEDVDDVPVVAGALADEPPAEADDGADSAAERAARMARPVPAAPAAAAQPRPRRRRLKPWLVGIAVLVVLAGALGGLWAWTRSQFFVGENGTQVAIFRGVNTAFGPLKLYTVERTEALTVGSLTEACRDRVKDGITADGLAAATDIVERLKEKRADGACGYVDRRQPADTSGPASTSPSAGGTPSGSGSSAGLHPSSASHGAPASSATRR